MSVPQTRAPNTYDLHAAPEERAEIEGLVGTILDRKAADAGADVSAEEAEIDRLVSRLYFGDGAEEV